MLKLPYHFSLFVLADWFCAKKSGLLLLPSSYSLPIHQEISLLYQALYGYLSPQKCWKLSIEYSRALGIDNASGLESSSLLAPIDHVDDLVFLLKFMEGLISIPKERASPLYELFSQGNSNSPETLEWKTLPAKSQERFFSNKLESIIIAPNNLDEIRYISPWLLLNEARS